MFLVKTFGAWNIRRKIKRAEDGLNCFVNIKPDDKLYGDAQQLIPLVKAEILELRQQLFKLTGLPR